MADYNAVIYASNAKYFDPAVPHSMPVDTVHTLAADSKKLATSVGAGWVDNLDNTYTGTTATSDITGISTDTSGTVKVTITLSSVTAGDVNGYSANGTYTFEETLTASLNLTGTGFTGIVTVVSIEAITLPTASYIQYLSYPSLTWKQLSSTVDYGYGTIPVSTTWPLTESFQVAINSTAPLSAADILELNADPDLMFKVWDGTVASLSSGFSAANIVGFLDGTSGNTGHKHVQDINVALGTENVNPAGVQLFGTGNTSALNATLDGYDIHVETADVSYRPIVQFTRDDASITKLNLVTLTVSCSVGLAKLSAFEALSTYAINQEISAGQTFTYTFIDYMKVATSNYRATFDSAAYTLYDIEVKASIKEVSAKEIANFTTNVNTTYLNGTTGATNLKLIKDASGRTTGTAAAGTTQWAADGRSAVTGWTITAPFTVTEIVDGVTYTWTSDGNKYIDSVASGTYTLPTGVWTLSDNLLFDGVTTGTVRGNAQMINSIVIP